MPQFILFLIREYHRTSNYKWNWLSLSFWSQRNPGKGWQSLSVWASSWTGILLGKRRANVVQMSFLLCQSFSGEQLTFIDEGESSHPDGSVRPYLQHYCEELKCQCVHVWDTYSKHKKSECEDLEDLNWIWLERVLLWDLLSWYQSVIVPKESDTNIPTWSYSYNQHSDRCGKIFLTAIMTLTFWW